MSSEIDHFLDHEIKYILRFLKVYWANPPLQYTSVTKYTLFHYRKSALSPSSEGVDSRNFAGLFVRVNILTFLGSPPCHHSFYVPKVPQIRDVYTKSRRTNVSNGKIWWIFFKKIGTWGRKSMLDQKLLKYYVWLWFWWNLSAQLLLSWFQIWDLKYEDAPFSFKYTIPLRGVWYT